MAADRSAVRALRQPAPGRVAAVLAVAAIAVALPAVLIANGFRLVAHPWIVPFEYGRDGFPDDRYGLDRAQRTRLALVGLDSIRPGGEGIDLLRRATLPDGSPAFDSRELAHMGDVRHVFGRLLRLGLLTLVIVAAAAVALRRTRWRWIVPTGVLAGGLLTILVAVLLVPTILLGFDGFFVRFHQLFFDGDSWRFSDTDTLLRLYPERFWVDISQLLALLTVAQAAAASLAGWWWLRRVRESAA